MVLKRAETATPAATAADILTSNDNTFAKYAQGYVDFFIDGNEAGFGYSSLLGEARALIYNEDGGTMYMQAEINANQLPTGWDGLSLNILVTKGVDTIDDDKKQQCGLAWTRDVWSGADPQWIKTVTRETADDAFSFQLESVWLDWEADSSYPITGRTIVLQDPDTLERLACGQVKQYDDNALGAGAFCNKANDATMVSDENPIVRPTCDQD